MAKKFAWYFAAITKITDLIKNSNMINKIKIYFEFLSTKNELKLKNNVFFSVIESGLNIKFRNGKMIPIFIISTSVPKV